MIDCLVARNSSDGWVGGVSAGWGGNPILGCTIEENVAAGGAGGVYVGNTHVIDCRISGNVAERGGGVIASSGWLGKAVITGCEIVGNQAVRGGGVEVIPSGFGPHIDLDLSNSTVSGNYASEEGGGILVSGDFKTSLSHTVLWNNCSGGTGGELWLADSTSTVEFFCSAIDTTGIEGPGLATFDGNMVFEHPRFCSPVSCAFAPSTNGDYTLAASSPCLPEFSPCDSLIGALGEGCAITDVPREEKSARPGVMMSLYPNPFVNSVHIEFAVGEEAAQIHIHDVAGRLIRQFKRLQGDGNLVWDGLDHSGRLVPAGIYFVTLKLPSITISRRVVLLR